MHRITATLLTLAALASPLAAQTLDEELQRLPTAQLAAMAKAEGDASRGAVVFHQQQMSCAKCHALSLIHI